MSKALHFISAKEAAAFCGVSVDIFLRWLKGRDPPPRRLIGKRFYYQREMLTHWMTAPLTPEQPKSRQSAFDRRPAA